MNISDFNFGELNRYGRKPVVVDLRDNPGGYPEMFNQIFDEIDKEKMKYYCLLNNNSLSAAIVLAARLKNKNGLLLGQNCGQPYKFYAWGGGVQKTKSGIRFKCSKKLQICKVDGKVLSNKKPFPVDYEVQTTIEDLKKNKDAVLSYCESLIKQHKLNAEKF